MHVPNLSLHIKRFFFNFTGQHVPDPLVLSVRNSDPHALYNNSTECVRTYRVKSWTAINNRALFVEYKRVRQQATQLPR